MNVWYRLGIPVVIGLAAAVFNFMAVRLKVQPQVFAAPARSIPQGGTIQEGDFTPIKICTDNRHLSTAAVPWDGRMSVLDTRAARTLEAGQVLLFSDLRVRKSSPPPGTEAFVVALAREQARAASSVQIGDQVSFALSGPDKAEPELLGRFWVLNLDSGDANSSSAGSSFTLTVAVRMLPGTGKFGPKSQRLIGSQTRASDERILFLHPHDDIVFEKEADIDETELHEEYAHRAEPSTD